MTDATPLQGQENRHATAVAFDQRAVLIEGPSGSGKSTLALDLIARGGTLVADDRVQISLREGWPWAFAQSRHPGVIEARHVGLIRTDFLAAAPVALHVDMGHAEADRLPMPRTARILGQDIPSLRRVDAVHFAAAIMVLLKGGLWQDV